VHWRSIRQSTVAKSTMIAEYYAASAAADEVVFFRHLLGELGYSLGPTPWMSDNASACSILDKPVVNDRSRHTHTHTFRSKNSVRLIQYSSGLLLIAMSPARCSSVKKKFDGKDVSSVMMLRPWIVFVAVVATAVACSGWVASLRLLAHRNLTSTTFRGVKEV
jgi:hypothetical protein